LIRLSALGISTIGGVPVNLSVSVAGTAQRCQLTFEFARASLEVSFFPEGFRVLPIRSTPVDDLAASLGRTVRYGLERSPIGRRYKDHSSPHSLIYLDHLFRVTRATASSSTSPFSLSGVDDTMQTIFDLQDAVASQAKSGTAI
jgi:hypothetical protein